MDSNRWAVWLGRYALEKVSSIAKLCLIMLKQENNLYYVFLFGILQTTNVISVFTCCLTISLAMLDLISRAL